MTKDQVIKNFIEFYLGTMELKRQNIYSYQTKYWFKSSVHEHYTDEISLSVFSTNVISHFTVDHYEPMSRIIRRYLNIHYRVLEEYLRKYLINRIETEEEIILSEFHS